jgi:ABC-type glycerol-3-phosphate transport system substrate-binding protein
MKRKILTTVIAVAMAIGLVACGSTTKEDTKATTESSKVDET